MTTASPLPLVTDTNMNDNGKPQSGVTTSWRNAPTRTVAAGGVDYAHRELGPKAGVPVIFLVHLAGTLDNWDPRVVDGIAAKHRVIAFDNRGVGASTGETPDSIQAMAKDAVTFIRALGFDQVDLHGFSMGGMIAQVIAEDEPVRLAKGDNDRMLPTPNTLDMARRLPNNELVIYPDAGHAGIFQFHEQFVEKALEFLAK